MEGDEIKPTKILGRRIIMMAENTKTKKNKNKSRKENQQGVNTRGRQIA